jgi:hypothetical protein
LCETFVPDISHQSKGLGMMPQKCAPLCKLARTKTRRSSQSG